MDLWIDVSLAIVPTLIFIAAVVLRGTVEMQMETQSSSQLRGRLFLYSYLLLIIGIFLLVATAVLGRPVALMPLFILIVTATQLVSVELRIAGTRRRSQEGELLWILATSVKSGRSLSTDIEAYAKGTWGKRRTQLHDFARRLKRGRPDTELAVPQGLLSRRAILDIQAGLRAGKLSEALASAATRQTQYLIDNNPNVNIQGSLGYPFAILTSLSLIFGFLTYYIVPKFLRIFQDFNVELPPLTRSVIQMFDSTLTMVSIPPLLLGLIGAVVLGRMADYYGWPYIWQRFVGTWFIRPHASDVLRSLSTTADMGAPLDRALDFFVTSSGPILL
ncbi:MAG: hypothetical protein FJ267_11015, partial [Planctomycetes bacterium]|nr:hypothetical protein [Planctomycetota bacterium]